jgi:poly(3-hydroxybutyrate) depolymerase
MVAVNGRNRESKTMRHPNKPRRIVTVFLLISGLTLFSAAPTPAYAGGITPRDPDLTFYSSERPSLVYLPTDYDPTKQHALVVALGGYTDDAAYFVNEWALGGLVDLDRIILVAPEGAIHPFLGEPFWNAMPSCCGFEPIFGPMADDSGFLATLVDDLLATFPIDSARVYFLGGSNGGAMAYRFALDHPEKVAAVVSVAGLFNFPAFPPAAPTSILEIHGTADTFVNYFGGYTVPGVAGWEFTEYPGVHEVVAYWAALAGCHGELSTYGAALDLDKSVPGAETERQRYRGCRGNVFVELWTMYGSDHPNLWDLAVAEREGTTRVALAAWEWLRTKKK